ncbi:putative kinase C-like, phorbol ester/diacylglycerol-binding protein [Helianthus annuus]|nr:putative kinase C-like, phorbol ester/diacylglycerol-binding protein [Helianthus annuus]KAJ0771554.1 putative kinase C-like, phorbol ester/diacylglycerol-binding protein [Helianthus annuus]
MPANSMTIFFNLSESNPTVKNFDDADCPDLFHLPFPDQTYSIPRQLFSKEIGAATNGIDKVRLQHTAHHHELILVDTKCIDGANLCHNPMKKIELLCNGCVRPITEMPFYKCGANEDDSCNFALHEWCTRLPAEVHNHPGHPQHPLVLMSHVPDVLFNLFLCEVCSLPCNGYAYGCSECHYYVDVTCGFIPKRITHKSHPDHLLSVEEIPYEYRCFICISNFYEPMNPPISPTYPKSSPQLGFSCRICDVYIHSECALLLPETIRHAYDKHPMNLSYLPIENHKSEYFCEVCENKLNPHSCFYHCNVCAQSVHSACAPLILCCETETHSMMPAPSGITNSPYSVNIYRFLNVKFGSIHKFHGHPHPLSFAQGIESDGQCSMCSLNLRYKLIYKCLKCKFAIDYECFKTNSSSL